MCKNAVTTVRKYHLTRQPLLPLSLAPVIHSPSEGHHVDFAAQSRRVETYPLNLNRLIPAEEVVFDPAVCRVEPIPSP